MIYRSHKIEINQTEIEGIDLVTIVEFKEEKQFADRYMSHDEFIVKSEYCDGYFWGLISV